MSWEITGNAGTNPPANFLGTTDNEPLVIKTNGAEQLRINVAGNVGIGAASPSARLSVVAPGAAEIAGATRSATLLTSADPLGTPVGSEQALASFGLLVDSQNNVSLGVRAIRTSSNGTGWPTTAIGLGMDVDNTVRAGAALFLHANGNIGIGTEYPSAKLSVVAPGAGELLGTARSATLLTSADPLGTPVGSEQALASFGLRIDNDQNNVSLGVRAIRTSSNGTGWPTTAIGLGMDVDNTIRAGAALFLHANGNVGIGTDNPKTALHLPENGLQIGFSDTSSDNFHMTSDTVDGRGFRLWNGNYGAGSLLLTVFPNGDLAVTGDVLLTGADCAEEFEAAEAAEIEPGTVMVIDHAGALQQSRCAYDKRVAGVVSGAGNYRPGLILDKQQTQDNRLPIALVGKVYCRVDAQYGPIEVGDLLTTSPTLGHAMKADDPQKTFGSVLGKALRPLGDGQGLIPILIALQ